jgi:hypothetical protein
MKTLSEKQLTDLAGDYFAPCGLYHQTKAMPFLGTINCNIKALVAGQWTELVIVYTVGASGLADGAWIKGTFKFYSDWALFQTSDSRQNNYVSAEYTAGPLVPGQTPATVQSLSVRFDQKGHERPFQKAIIVDIVDGYLNPGDKITIRLGDRRWGAKGTRAQTFVEDAFLMRWYIDPIGTSRFAPIKPDIAIPILPGPPSSVKVITPRVARPDTTVPIHIHAEDKWGNATSGLADSHAILIASKGADIVETQHLELPAEGWSVTSTALLLSEGEYSISVKLFKDDTTLAECVEPLSIESSLPVSRAIFADLHVHSDDTVGTNSTTYNFSYARQVAGLDVVGYTANDFNVTQSRWNATLATIRDVNAEGTFIVFPGTEWCGNSAAGGDHNIVFLDPHAVPEFPFDRHGNVARSFEWNEEGPEDLVPGAWPLDELYATYARDADNHLLIPHVGGRRCNLAWHHPRLERLLEIGSAWGLFEWLLRDAIQRGWRMGVSANSDEHRGRCGGGVPGTAVFGTKGGLTGLLTDTLGWREVGQALRARRTFATTGERLVGILRAGDALQGDEVSVPKGTAIDFDYSFFGSTGFTTIEAWDATGLVFHRDLQAEIGYQSTETRRKIRVKWGGARLYDRYREAVWHGSILIEGATIHHVTKIGGCIDSPEDSVDLVSATQIAFNTKTSGDFDGVDIWFEGDLPSLISVTGQLGGYVKTGDPLKGKSHLAQPEFRLHANAEEATKGKRIEIRGGADLFVSVEDLLDVKLPTRVDGRWTALASSIDSMAVYFVGREAAGGKVITSPIFVDYE